MLTCTFSRPVTLCLAASGALLFIATAVTAQDAPGGLAPAAVTGDQTPVDHTQMNMGTNAGWQLVQDGIVFAEYNHQSGRRGGDEFVAPNWWMGMASKHTSRGQLTFTGMFSLDRATVGRSGYREIFQAGETLDGRPLIDHQHPHELFMQLAGVWRIPVTDQTGFTLAGGPVGEPALGPVAFMHRASGADNPTAPLGHHTLDSTHVSFGIVTAAVDHGPWLLEASVFNGREPDERRWDFDFGRLDSFSGRVWFRPSPGWELQVSSGRLHNPEALEPGDIVRTTASVSWTRATGANVRAMTLGYGRNQTEHGARNAFFLEGARHVGAGTVYTRFEALQVETELLKTGQISRSSGAEEGDPVIALTVGGGRDMLRVRGVEGGIGADATFYRAPDTLQSVYDTHGVSLHVFFVLRPRAGSMGRMWNMRMSQPMLGHGMR